MSDVYNWMKRWEEPCWQPKAWGGHRIPRKLKKRLQGAGFFWFGPRPECFPGRWLPGTYTIPNLLPRLIACKRWGLEWPPTVVTMWNLYTKEISESRDIL